MLFYTDKVQYKNIKLVDTSGKDILQFKNNVFETNDKKLIALLKNKNKYPFVKWDESRDTPKKQKVKKDEEKEEKEENKI